ncbi:hypothetical protein K440DRAFT_672064 [Wilcoxina mikolae CBS 423.85]|nr:hypothetical protein K440DRAFT_672064 [Wilcoxina mikolae CBS 423.85]
MHLTIQRPTGTNGYTFTFTGDPSYPKLILSLDPPLVQNPYILPRITGTRDPINLILISPSYTPFLLDATLSGCTFTHPFTRLLSSPTLITKLSKSSLFPSETLHPLKRNTPYITFTPLSTSFQQKLEIELLSEKPHAWGIKFCYRESVDSPWGCISCLLAPYRVSPSDAKVWCDTLGETGLNRVETTDWDLVDAFVSCSRGQQYQGRLDILIHPFEQPKGAWMVASASLASFHHRSLSMNPRGSFDLCRIVKVETWIYPTKSNESGERNRLPLLEAALRSHGVTVYGGFEEGGVKVIEMGPGMEHAVRRSAPIVRQQVLRGVENIARGSQGRPGSFFGGTDSEVGSIRESIRSVVSSPLSVMHLRRLWMS